MDRYIRVPVEMPLYILEDLVNMINKDKYFLETLMVASFSDFLDLIPDELLGFIPGVNFLVALYNALKDYLTTTFIYERIGKYPEITMLERFPLVEILPLNTIQVLEARRRGLI